MDGKFPSVWFVVFLSDAILNYLHGFFSVSNIDHDCISKNCNRGRCASPIVLDKCADQCIDDAQCGGGQCMGGQCGIAGEVEFGCGW